MTTEKILIKDLTKGQIQQIIRAYLDWKYGGIPMEHEVGVDVFTEQLRTGKIGIKEVVYYG